MVFTLWDNYCTKGCVKAVRPPIPVVTAACPTQGGIMLLEGQGEEGEAEIEKEGQQSKISLPCRDVPLHVSLFQTGLLH